MLFRVGFLTLLAAGGAGSAGTLAAQALGLGGRSTEKRRVQADQAPPKRARRGFGQAQGSGAKMILKGRGQRNRRGQGGVAAQKKEQAEAGSQERAR